MNLIDKWVLNRAKKISKAKEEKQKLEANEYQNRYKERKDLEEKAKSILNEHLQTIIERMKTEEDHIKPGDVAILNKYGLVFNPYNGWDGGPNSYLGHCKPEDKTTPIIVDIQSIIIDTSLATEKIDRWIDNLSNTELESRIKGNRLITTYTGWVSNQNSITIAESENLFIYKTAMFKAQFKEFNPRWGLCIQSFLEINSEEGKKTKEIWLEEISLEFAEKQIRERLKEIENQKIELVQKTLKNK